MTGAEFWMWALLVAVLAWIAWRVLLGLARSFDTEFEAVDKHRRQMDALTPENDR